MPVRLLLVVRRDPIGKRPRLYVIPPKKSNTKVSTRHPGSVTPNTSNPMLSLLYSGILLTQNNAADAIVDVADQKQVVDGFGFSTAWGNMPGNQTNIDAFLSVTKGAGFSIVRTRIPFRENPDLDDNFLAKENGRYTFTTITDSQGTYKKFNLNWQNWDLERTKNFLATIKDNPDYQVTKVFSTPWTPPNNQFDRWKLPDPPESNNIHRLTEERYATRPEVGGYLDPEHYQDYADVLADYVLEFKENMGTDLYALSIQNEPGYDADYESCNWTPAQFRDFLLVLKRQFHRKGVWKANPDLKIMAPEDNNFHDSKLNEVYANPETRNLVHIAAGHQYEYGPWSLQNDLNNLFTERDTYRPNPFNASRKHGKQVWMTEWSMEAFNQTTPINRGLIVARAIHQNFTLSGQNAFVYWWSSSLLQDGNPNKSLWAMAHYSRYVRPGWHRISVTETPAPGVHLTAFAHRETRQVAIVAVNTSSTEKSISINLKGARSFESLRLHRTSANQDMADLGPQNLSRSRTTIKLAPLSIYTLQGKVNR